MILERSSAIFVIFERTSEQKIFVSFSKHRPPTFVGDASYTTSASALKPLIESCTRRLASSMAQALQTHGVIPDVVDKVPASVLSVTYPGNLLVEIGKVLTPTQVKDKPTVTWSAEANGFYTLCMTDPDAPSRQQPKYREWHHWLVANIPGSDVAKGEVLSDYIGSGPPEGTGLHRYVFLLYKQPGKLDFTEKRLTNRSGDDRATFSIKKFADKYKLGDPIAGNMYQAEYDDYVPILYKQLGA
ncbi:hypothetical protein KM043_001285 [Ampulex compressa]|nr:hypothetical protein KM043_001285 [Ampulex compressa]